MDAVKYLKEKKRMCEKSSCMYCPLGRASRNSEDSCDTFIRKSPEEAVPIVEQWSREHPAMTNEQKFREVFGETHSLVKAPPEWWVAEYKEPKGEQK